MKTVFEGLKVLCPLPGAPISSDYPTRQAHLEATNVFISQYFDGMPSEDQTLYRCLKCKDEGGYITKEERFDRIYEFWNECDCSTKGAWAKPNFGFPDYVQRTTLRKLQAEECERIVKTIDGKRRVCLHVGVDVSKGYQLGLAMCADIANRKLTVKVISARSAPTDFNQPWDIQVGRPDALFIIDLDRRLTPAQIQSAATLFDRSQTKALIAIGEPLKNLPKTNGWASIALALQAKGAKTVKA